MVMKMLYRKSYEIIKEWYFNSEKALLIDGARQVGKTTLIRSFFEENSIKFVEINLHDNQSALEAFNTSKDSKELLVKIIALADKNVEDGMVFFIDEIQEADDAITPIKFLIDSSSYKFVFSGSLLGVKMKNIQSIGVGYITIHKMYPMDFEEFCTANSVSKKTIDYLHDCFINRKTIDSIVHEQMMKLFNLYLIVGGMPGAVNAYVTTHNLKKVSIEHNDIDKGYLKDITKYDYEEKLLIEDIYNLIPSELNQQNKRMILKKLNEKARFYQYEESFIWLLNSGVGLFTYNVDNPVYPLLASKERTLFKLFLCDVGLLSSKLLNGNQIKILNGDVNLNFGAIYENVVAQELIAHGHELFFSNNKKRGEIDFLIEEDGMVIPLEIKSGKDYKRHSALNNLIKDFNVKKAYVFNNDNISIKNERIYVPIYMIMFIQKNTEVSDEIVIPEISSLV